MAQSQSVGDARIRNTPKPVREAATVNVMGTFAANRAYVGMLGYDELASMVVNQLLYDGWTLTPPEEAPDVSSDHQRDRGEGGS